MYRVGDSIIVVSGDDGTMTTWVIGNFYHRLILPGARAARGLAEAPGRLCQKGDAYLDDPVGEAQRDAERLRIAAEEWEKMDEQQREDVFVELLMGGWLGWKAGKILGGEPSLAAGEAPPPVRARPPGTGAPAEPPPVKTPGPNPGTPEPPPETGTPPQSPPVEPGPVEQPRDKFGRFGPKTGDEVPPGSLAEGKVWDAIEQKDGWTVIRGRVYVKDPVTGEVRVYDGAAISPSGRVIGLEVKQGTGHLTPSQRAFDKRVNSGECKPVGTGEHEGLVIDRTIEIKVPNEHNQPRH